MTAFTLRDLDPGTAPADVVVVGLLATKTAPKLAPGGESVAAAYGRSFKAALAALGAKGAAGEVTKLPASGSVAAPLIVVCGLGDAVTLQSVRRAAAAAARAVGSARKVTLALPTATDELLRAAVEGFELAGYSYARFKKAPESPRTVVVVSASPRTQRGVLQRIRTINDAVLHVRDLVNEPPNVMNPPVFAETMKDRVAEINADSAVPVTVEVWDEKRLAKEGCGGILGVGKASATPPRLVMVSYAPPKATSHLALIGKGITFDSGGLTIKPSNAMDTMKCDMAGAATVMEATLAIARLGLPIRVTALAALAENMVSGNAMRPGDILTMRDGQTVEVLNTDAEGRLVLADALSVAVDAEPDVMIDVATLTGHMVIALGDKIGGAMGREHLVRDVHAVGQTVGETHWPMPIPPDMYERVKASTIADVLQHDWTRWGGGLMAAAFLDQFTAGRPWVHLDIAGPAFASAADGHWTAGGTGFGVSTLVEYAASLAREA